MEPKVGSFCWFELATSDRVAAQKFYSAVFGWEPAEVPMGPEMTYTMLRLKGNDVGGVYALMKDQIAAHVPPHWMPYIKVESVDESASKASKLGAKSIVPPSDIPNVGRFAVIQDPTGAVTSIFQPGQHRGLLVFGEVGAPCWVDLNTPDSAKAKRFYSDWLGWTFDESKDGYAHIMNGGHENMIGGVPTGMHAPPGTPAHWIVYFHAADSKATAAKAAQLGARTLMPAELIQDVGTIGVLADPQGAAFALYQPL
jgi:predicted enzyme related to lactoylglutathione lyase